MEACADRHRVPPGVAHHQNLFEGAFAQPDVERRMEIERPSGVGRVTQCQPGGARIGEAHVPRAAPADPDEETAINAVGEQLAKLKLLHAETGQLIGRIESRLDRLSQSPMD